MTLTNVGAGDRGVQDGLVVVVVGRSGRVVVAGGVQVIRALLGPSADVAVHVDWTDEGGGALA